MVSFLTLTSCSNEDINETSSNAVFTMGNTLSQEDKAIINDIEIRLDEYNHSLPDYIEFSGSTRGSGKGWLRRFVQGIVTIACDAIGGAIGAGGAGMFTENPAVVVSSGIGAGSILSGLVGFYVFGSDTDFGLPFLSVDRRNASYYTSNTVFIDDPTLYTIGIDSVGYYHNVALHSTFENEDSLSYFSNLSSFEKGLYIVRKLDSFKNVSSYLAINDIVNFTQIADEICEAIDKSDSYDDYTNQLEKITDMPELTKLITTYVEGVASRTNVYAKNFYTQHAISEIIESELPLNIKNQIIISFVIGNASSRLWITNENQEE